MTPAELTGQARTHVSHLPDLDCTLQVDTVTAFRNLRRAAGEAGFMLQAVSSFRDFPRQLAIWNGKFDGSRPLLAADGTTLDAATLTAAERISAILQWSALPGASRHHWGTDVDLVDTRAVPPGYRVRLVAEEFAAGGPFAELGGWLEAHAARYGFFRPFRGVASGVRAEPWHYSFAPVSDTARRALTPAVLRAALAGAPLLGKEEILERVEALHARYVAAIDWP